MRSTRLVRPTTPSLVLLLALVVQSMAAGAAAQDESDLPPSATLQDFLRLAELRSPGLEASRRLWRAEAEAVGAAGSFPDPQLTLAWYAEEVETRVGAQKQRVSVRQRLPWFGKLGLSQDVAEEGAGAARARFGDRRLELHRDVTLAWLDLYWVGRSITLTGENLDLLINLEHVIRERYRIGRVAHSDLVRVQVALGITENRLHSLQDQLRPAVARMNALLHRADDALVPVPSDLPEWSSAPDMAEVKHAIQASSPRLRERQRQVAQADAAERLADRSRWPDWMVGADWIRTDDALDPTMEDSGKDPLVLTVSVNLPVFRGKWDAPARAAEERAVAARARLSLEEDQLLARAENVLFEWRDADRRANLYHGVLLPKARESYQALDTAYRTGQGGFLDLMEAQRTLLEFELERERALTDRGHSVARLNYLTGDFERKEGSQ